MESMNTSDMNFSEFEDREDGYDVEDGDDSNQDGSHGYLSGNPLSSLQKFSDGEHSDSATGTDNAQGNCEPLREQDRFLPIANVSRIMKLAVPRTGKIAKDAKECLQECVSEFISFLTSEAADRCAEEKRKTINGEDILYAMQALGFDNYVTPMKNYLNLYRDYMIKEQRCANEEQEVSSRTPNSQELTTSASSQVFTVSSSGTSSSPNTRFNYSNIHD